MWRSSGKITLLALVVTTLVSAGFAQEAIKVGIVNSNEVIQKSTEGKAVMAQLQEKDKTNSAKLTTMDEKIRELETKLEQTERRLKEAERRRCPECETSPE